MDINLLEQAFRKLLTFTYFDKSDMDLRRCVAEFAQIVSKSKTAAKAAFKRIDAIVEGKDEQYFISLLNEMSMRYYPKKIVEDKKDNAVITNKPSDKCIVERFLIKSHIPVELLIIDTAWVIKYGIYLDKNLLDCCYANRLDLTANERQIRKGNNLFKKYSKQYRRWWSDGLAVANSHLKEGKDVTIINFDLKDYYHSVDLDFDYIVHEVASLSQDEGVFKDPLTDALYKIYHRYWFISTNSGIEALTDKSEHPLPLSLLSACIFANYSLKDFDSYVLDNIKPLYYGRYVDDCMLVTYTKSSSNDPIDCINEELPGLIEQGDSDYYISFDRFSLNNFRRIGQIAWYFEEIVVL